MMDDLRAMGGDTGLSSWLNIFDFYIKRQAFRVVVNYRLGNLFRCRGLRIAGAWFDRRNWRKGVDICSLATIGKGIRIAHPIGIVIGGGVRIGENVQIQQNVSIGGNFGKARPNNPRWTSPRIGDNVFIGPGAVVVGPIQIGNGARIGANAVVTRDVPEGAQATGYNQIKVHRSQTNA